MSEKPLLFRSGFFIFIYSGMLNESTEFVPISPDNIKAGLHVNHPEFGDGIIVSVRSDGVIAHILFSNGRARDIRVTHAIGMTIEEKLKKKPKERIRWYRHGKLHESDEYDEYKVGDEVIVNGTIDDREFNNYLCKITAIGMDSFNIKPLEDHDDGFGFDTWWVDIRYIKPAEPIEKGPVRVRWYSKGKLHESYFTGTGGDLEGFKNKLKGKIGHDFEIKGNKIYFMASEDEDTEKQLKIIAKPFGVKIQLEKMNIKDFNSFVNEEYMYRHDPSTKTERYEKQRQYFIRQITRLDKEKSKEELEKMSIEDLGKLLNKIKKEM